MAQPLRVLLLEDLDTDAELMVRELKQAGFDLVWDRVETEESLLECLDRPYDLILSDNSMPSFDAMKALSCLQQRKLDIPLVIVSGSIGEEQAVALLHHGAADYIMKDRIERLGSAVGQVLEKKRLRDDNQAAHAALQARTEELIRSQERLRALASDLTLTEQRERRKLAGDLHDYLAQLLVAGRMKLRQAVACVAKEPGTTLLAELDQIFDESLRYTRTLIADLAPPSLQEFGLSHAFQWLSEHMRTHGLTVDVQVGSDRINLPDDQAILVFQSVRELLLNIVKHADTNRAIVAVATTPTELHITVTDGGQGFDHTAVAAPEPGSSGFGLFSIDERMRAMGGRFEINSTPGHGTRASMILPYWPAAAPELREPLKEELSDLKAAGHPDRRSGLTMQPSPEQSLVRVLLVDDHVMVRRGIKSLTDGHDNLRVIGEASDGEQAVELTAQLRPDVVLMDVNLPVMDGVTATSRIHQDHPDIVIVGLSVHDDRQIVDAMTKAGAAAFVSKGSVTEELYEAISRALVSKGKRSGSPRRDKLPLPSKA
jgi:signal transduction histidine kinase